MDFPEALFPVFAADPNPRARFWFALGFNQGPPESRVKNWPEVLARFAISDGTNRWMRAAILSGLKPGESQALQLARYLAQQTNDPAPVEFWSDLGRVLGAETGTLPLFFPTNAPPSPWLIAALDGVAESLRSRGKPVALPVELLPRFTAEAARLAASPAEPIATRKAAIGFLVNAESAQAGVALLPVLVATEPAELQLAAVRSLLGFAGRHRGDGTAHARALERAAAGHARGCARVVAHATAPRPGAAGGHRSQAASRKYSQSRAARDVAQAQRRARSANAPSNFSPPRKPGIA